MTAQDRKVTLDYDVNNGHGWIASCPKKAVHFRAAMSLVPDVIRVFLIHTQVMSIHCLHKVCQNTAALLSLFSANCS